MNDHFAQRFVQQCTQTNAPSNSDVVQLVECNADEVTSVLEEFVAALRNDTVRADAPLWEKIFGALHVWQQRFGGLDETTIPAETRVSIVNLYRQLGPACPARFRLLQLLTFWGQEADVTAFAQAVCDDPPGEQDAAALPFIALLRPGTAGWAAFPHLIAGLSHPQCAAPIVDLANYLVRSQQTERHPLEGEKNQLARMLGALTRELERLQLKNPAEHPTKAAETEDGDANPAAQTQTSLALVISLCDALALIGDESAMGTLRPIIELQHRRLRLEAAAALARFGDEQGKAELVRAASDPATRLRALHYADELDLENEVPESQRTPDSIAEAELYSYLMQPNVMGVAPTSCELVDSQTMYWPGYEEPRQCYLFRYTYEGVVAGQPVSFSNIGIAGPVAHVFQADLGNLPIEDIYAAYAGWHAEHPEMIEHEIDDMSHAGSAVATLRRRLEEKGYDCVVPRLCGDFFGSNVLAATAERTGVAGVAVVDAESIAWYPSGSSRRPLSPHDAYAIYKGRRLLRQFN